MTHHRERDVDRLGLDPVRLSLCDERLQRSHVHLTQIQLADERIELLQVKRIFLDALLVQVSR